MPASEIRKNAREALRGKWGKAVCITLVYMFISFVIVLVQGFFNERSLAYSLIGIAYIVISIPMSFGLIISFMKLKRNENVSAVDFLKDGFSRFNRSWGIWFYTFLKLILPIICLVFIMILMAVLISASLISTNSNLNMALVIVSVVLYIASIVYVISRALLYSIAYYIGYDNPELSSKACVLKSEALMNGNRGNLFLLLLSFIGWAILAVLTLGIGILWLFPYMQVALVCFYERVVKPDNQKEE